MSGKACSEENHRRVGITLQRSNFVDPHNSLNRPCIMCVQGMARVRTVWKDSGWYGRTQDRMARLMARLRTVIMARLRTVRQDSGQDGKTHGKTQDCNYGKTQDGMARLRTPWQDSGKTQDGMARLKTCLLYTSPSPRDRQKSRMPSSA